MESPKKRKGFSINRYEKKIIFLIFFIPVMLCIFFTSLAILFYNNLIELILTGSTDQVTGYLSQSLISILVVTWGFVLLFYVVVRMIASNMLGAFERLLQDIDKMNSTGVKGPLHCRKHDTLTGELVQRLNVFIDKFKN